MPGLKRTLEDDLAPSSKSRREATDEEYSPRKSQKRSPSHEVSKSGATLDEQLAYEEQFSQIRFQQASRSRASHPVAENGILELITCTNFMCHRHLQISLGPLVNFIIGHNGSGKSAVLTALSICLGGRASATNRGQSLRSFVREGADSASVSVQIKNQGTTAFQPDAYGKSIIIERHFTRAGGSVFKLKDHSGRLISNRKSDLDEICDYFALQIDNPLNILTQDMARQFLNSSSAHDKYRFFMKGTQLEHLDGDYLIVEENLDTIEEELLKKSQDCERLKAISDECQRKLQLSREQDTLNEKIQQLGGQAAWVQVESQERALVELEDEIQKCSAEIERQESLIVSLGEAFVQTQASLSQADAKISEIKSECDELKEKKATVKALLDSVKVEQRSLQSQMRDMSGELRAAQHRIGTNQRKIVEENQRLSDNGSGVKSTEIRHKIDQFKKQITDAQDNLQTNQKEIATFENERQQVERKKESLGASLSARRHILKEAEDTLISLTREQGGEFAAYNPAMSRLVASINNSKTFREKPVGPQGRYVRLLQPSWSSILEKSLGSSLDAFLVTNQEDQVQLTKLMTECRCSFPILIIRRQPIDTSGHEPPAEFQTILRVLQIDNELVRNSLIINQIIDQSILIAHHKDAIARMNGARIPNVKQCFTHNVAPGTGSRLAYGYGGGLSESFQQAWKGLPRMRTDQEAHVRSQKALVVDYEKECRALQAELESHISSLRSVARNLTSRQSTEKRLKDLISRHRRAIDDLQDELDSGTIEEGHLSAIEAQLKEAEEDLVTQQNSFKEAEAAKAELTRSSAEHEHMISGIDAQISEISQSLHDAERKRMALEEGRRNALHDKNKSHDGLRNLNTNKEDFRKQVTNQLETVAEFKAQAAKVCPRVQINPNDTEHTIHQKLNKLQDELQRAERRTGDRADLAKKAESALASHEIAITELKAVKDLTSILKETIMNRKERWERFRNLITSRARCQFFYLLTQRGFRGNLQTDHDLKTLELTIEPDETQISGRGRSTHGLSGGEKSFSTICFLLAIWEAMGAPVRALDEFDVFMDSVNREISMQLMITFAKDSPGKQFILISPQTAGKQSADQNVKLIRMLDPERGQRNLNFTSSESTL